MKKENAIIRTFNRFELKYLITRRKAEQFKSDLKAYLNPDLHGNDSGCYRLGNLYYDSPDLRCYYEKENGTRIRKKLRIRYYETEAVFTEKKPVYVEIKQRVDRVTQKRRIVLPYYQAIELCNDRRLPDLQNENREILEEIYAFLWSYNLRPSSIVRYSRAAYSGRRFDIGLRVTFDTVIMCQPHPLHLHEQLTGIPMLDANMVVMEIKVNERIPIWLTQMIAKHNLKIVPFSKYCRSIAATREMPFIYGMRPQAESTMDVLSSSYSVFQKKINELTERRN
jgi:hypothetical protein